MDQIKEYGAIADSYADSMRLPFRDAIEKHTLLEMLGDLSGTRALDHRRVRRGAIAATLSEPTPAR